MNGLDMVNKWVRVERGNRVLVGEVTSAYPSDDEYVVTPPVGRPFIVSGEEIGVVVKFRE